MPFNTTDQGVPYYGKPVEPDVPVAPREPQGERIGGALLSAWVQNALGRERATIEREQMVQHADLAAKQLGFDKEKLGQQYDLATKAQELHAKQIDQSYALQSRGFDLEQERNNFQSEHQAKVNEALDWKMEQDKKEYSSTFQRNLAFAKSRAKMLEEARQVAGKLNLDDPAFQTNHPMQFAANALEYHSMYGGTVDKELKANVNKYWDQANASKIKLDAGDGKPQEYSWAHIAEDMQTNGLQSPFVEALKNANQFDVNVGGAVNPATNLPSITTRTLKKDAMASRMLADAKGADFASSRKAPSRVDSYATNATEAIADGSLAPGPSPDGGVFDSRTTSSGRLNPGAAMPADAPPTLPPPRTTALDSEVAYVKQKIASNPARAGEYKAYFAQRHPDQDASILGQ